MFWIVITLVLALIGVACLVVGRFLSRSEHSDDRSAASWCTAGFWLVALLILVFSLVRSAHSIDYGNVAVVKTFGGITGQVDDGLQFTLPWQDLEVWNTQTQRVRPTGDCYNGRFKECLEAFSSDNQDVFIQPTLNLRVDPKDVQGLARGVGPQYLDKVVRPLVQQITKDETVNYHSKAVAPSREELRLKIAERLRKELTARSINVEDLLLENVDFRDEFKRAIEDTVIAEQNSLAEGKKVEIAKEKAKQVKETAEGEANKLRVEAQGQADANNLINASLTPLLIQFQAVQKLAPNVQIALLPSGQGIIIDPATLLAQSK